MPDSAQNIFSQTVSALSNAGISSPRLEARILFAHILSDHISSLNPHNIVLNSQQLSKLEKLVNERLSHKPVCKVIGKKDFYKNSFVVNQDVLSPRPDTEVLVEEAIKIAKQNNLKSVLDLGIGSGCILLSIINDCPMMSGVGVDASIKALDVAAINAKKLDLSSAVKFIKADWFDQDFISLFNTKFDLIVSNPPYIPSADINDLEVEVKSFDPLSALDGGSDGYKDYQKLSEIIPLLLNDGGYVLLEVGINQARAVADLFMLKGLTLVAIIPDLSGIERCVIFKK